MSRTRLDVLAALFGLVALAPVNRLAAQAPAPGQRVRVTLAATTSPVVGDLVARDDSGIVLRLDPALTRRIAAADVRRIQVRHGIRSRLGAGAELGAFVGAVGGIVYAIATLSKAESCTPIGMGWGAANCVPTATWNVLTAVERIVPAALIGGAAGAVIGGGVGLLLRQDVWDEAPAAAPRRIARGHGRWDLGLSIAF